MRYCGMDLTIFPCQFVNVSDCLAIPPSLFHCIRQWFKNCTLWTLWGFTRKW